VGLSSAIAAINCTHIDEFGARGVAIRFGLYVYQSKACPAEPDFLCCFGPLPVELGRRQLGHKSIGSTIRYVTMSDQQASKATAGALMKIF
jgi:hypothetical protein